MWIANIIELTQPGTFGLACVRQNAETLILRHCQTDSEIGSGSELVEKIDGAQFNHSVCNDYRAACTT